MTFPSYIELMVPYEFVPTDKDDMIPIFRPTYETAQFNGANLFVRQFLKNLNQGDIVMFVYDVPCMNVKLRLEDQIFVQYPVICMNRELIGVIVTDTMTHEWFKKVFRKVTNDQVP